MKSKTVSTPTHKPTASINLVSIKNANNNSVPHSTTYFPWEDSTRTFLMLEEECRNRTSTGIHDSIGSINKFNPVSASTFIKNMPTKMTASYDQFEPNKNKTFNINDGDESKLFAIESGDDIDNTIDEIAKLNDTLEVIDYFISQGKQLNDPAMHGGVLSKERIKLLNEYAKAEHIVDCSPKDTSFIIIS